MLPFDQLASIKSQGNTVLAEDVACRIELASSNSTTNGVAYDYSGEADVAYADELVNKTNVKMEIGGVTYSVLQAETHDFIPYVELRLKRIRQG